MDDLTLPPELAQFAAHAVAAGRYRDLAEIVRTGVDLVRRRDEARTAFIASLEAAQSEGECTGFSTIEDVEAELDAIIAQEERGRA